MADQDAWNGDDRREADDAAWNNARSPSPRRDTRSPPRRSRSPLARNGDSRGRPEEPGLNPGNNLHVSGVSSKTTDRDLEDAFSKYGKVAKAQIMYDPHSRESRGFAFVTMETSEDADAAIAGMNGVEMQGRVINVQKARRGRARTPTPGRYFGPPKREMNRPYDPRPYDYRYRDYPPPRDYPPRDYPPRDYPPMRGGDPYERERYARFPPPRDYPPPRSYRDYSPPARRGYDDRRYDDRPPRRY